MTTLDNKIDFRRVAELWIKKKETSTKDSTYIHYYNLLKNHIEPKLGDEFIEDITLLKLEERLQHKLGDFSSKTYITISSPKSKSSIREIPVPDFIIERILLAEYPKGAYILTGTSDKFMNQELWKIDSIKLCKVYR